MEGGEDTFKRARNILTMMDSPSHRKMSIIRAPASRGTLYAAVKKGCDRSTACANPPPPPPPSTEHVRGEALKVEAKRGEIYYSMGRRITSIEGGRESHQGAQI